MKNYIVAAALFGAFTVGLVCAAGLATTAHADLPDAPVILDFGPGGCVPVSEICGDGIDQDCNGSDRPCGSGSDADFDGYGPSSDCNESDKKIYPGISVSCAAAGCSSGTKTCQANGTYTTCSCTPLCEATGGGRCYYISKLTGSDTNSGSFAQPFRTLAPVRKYYCSYGSGSCSGGDPRPTPVEVSLQPGDVVYLMSGLYDSSYMYSGTRYQLYLNSLSGTASAPITFKAYPGAHPVLGPADSSSEGITVVAGNYLVFEGIEIARTFQQGMWFDGGSNIELRNMWIHHVDGVDNNNLAGIKASHVTEFRVHHSIIHDNFDRTNADTGGEKTENSRNMVLFGGGNAHIHHNTIFQTPVTSASKTGSCVAYKHNQTLSGGTVEVNHNIFRNCFFAAIGSGTYGGRFHHNLILDSDQGVAIFGYGHASIDLVDNIIENNTIVHSRSVLYKPSDAVEYPTGTYGTVTFRKNIVTDNRTYSAGTGGINLIDIWGKDVILNNVLSSNYLQFNNNCYHNTLSSVQFCLFCGNGTASNSGGLYGMSTWRAQGSGLDTNSVEIDPQLDVDYAPQQAGCQSYGHFAP